MLIKPSKPKPTDNSKLGDVKTERVRLQDLNPAPYNPRSITKEAKRGLSESINQFGLLQPIIFNKRNMTIVGGHQRYYDLFHKNVVFTDAIPVDVDECTERKMNITLNNPNITGTYNETLQDILSDINMDELEELNLDNLLDDNELPDLTEPTKKEKDKPDNKHTCPKCNFKF